MTNRVALSVAERFPFADGHGFGPVGGNAHTDEEWCRIDTIVPRAQALALTTLEVAASPS